jgi:hypothetical protein
VRDEVPTAIDVFAHAISSKTYLANGEVLQVAGKRLEFLKLRGKTQILLISKRDGNHFKQK